MAKRGYLTCIVTGEERKDGPEERVRQDMARTLMGHYGYRKGDLHLEFQVKMGSERKRADIAIFPQGAEHEQDNVYIIIECKHAQVSDSVFEEAVEQLKSYMAACNNAHFGIAVAGARRVCFREVKLPDGTYKRPTVNDIPHASAPRVRFTVVEAASRPAPALQQAGAPARAHPPPAPHHRLPVAPGLHHMPASPPELPAGYRRAMPQQVMPQLPSWTGPTQPTRKGLSTALLVVAVLVALSLCGLASCVTMALLGSQ